MRAVIHYTPELEESATMAEESLRSFQEVEGWEPELRVGFTPKTAPELPIMPGGMLDSYEGVKRKTKAACVCNHIRLWFEAREPIAFVEHDTLCVGPPPKVESDVTHLSIETSELLKTTEGIPLTKIYCARNDWFGSPVFPGTAAYVVTPEGAKKLLSAVFTYGLEQSDLIINSRIVKMDAVRPSPVHVIWNTFNSSSGKYW